MRLAMTRWPKAHEHTKMLIFEQKKRAFWYELAEGDTYIWRLESLIVYLCGF